MPFPVLIAALLVLAGGALADPRRPAPDLATPHVAVPAFDDGPYGYEGDEGDRRAEPDDRDFNLYDEGEDEDGDSAHGPDDDEGWDIEEYGRSERA